MPGGGLWLLGLARPLARLAEQGEPGKDALNAIDLSLKRPFIALAATTGLDSYDAYAQVKACQPNQFYSLRHLGLHGAAAEGSPYADIPGMGLDVREGRFRDLFAAGIAQTPGEALAILELTRDICLAFADE